jgi:hypothetical protein
MGNPEVIGSSAGLSTEKRACVDDPINCRLVGKPETERGLLHLVKNQVFMPND